MSNDTTLLCVTCGAQSTGMFAELLRTGWPTCCGRTMLVTVDPQLINEAVAQATFDVAVQMRTSPASQTIFPARPRKASGRMPRRPA